ncbi:hypothetical protein EBB59_09430 [Lysobacter pythonis]|uniref:Uncharacterized protein n=1 Tax=Solilutibacter pythonis TaxID=2483112 RepID=A0A3M2HXH2_9GAMM|nr:hypothetical protein [Lysobacter pythonis]RMH90887.1 hypothetical protein EBB59_09430 [Lysobacter pythonis]
MPLAALAGFAAPLHAQERVVPAENVRIDYAQVLRVQPVYQVVNANARERHCTTIANKQRSECREVLVPTEFRRPIAYDVDYTYKGVKYRSRLAQDPGRRLRIRIGVTPIVGSEVGP